MTVSREPPATSLPPPGPDPAAAPAEPERFQTAAVATVAFGHFVHDTYPAFLGPLLPLLIPKLGMSLGAAGVLVSLLRWPGVLQPVLGYLADRSDPRYWVIFAPTVTALGMSLLGLAPSYLAVVLLLMLAGVSHAAFHPAGGAQVTRLSGRSWGRGTSFFMTGGELGRALGPLFIVAVVQSFGLEMSWLAVLPALLASLLLYWRLGRAPRLRLRRREGSLLAAIRQAGRALGLLAMIALFRNLASTSFQVFFPTFVTSSGGSLLFAGLAISIFELTGAAGAFMGGTLSDRFGRRTVLALGQALATPTLLGALFAPEGPLQIGLLAVAGLFALSGGPVQLVLIQELLPEHRSLATGLLLFLGLEGAVVASIGVGFLADAIGLGNALGISVGLSALSIPFVLLLPETRGAHSSLHG